MPGTSYTSPILYAYYFIHLNNDLSLIGEFCNVHSEILLRAMHSFHFPLKHMASTINKIFLQRLFWNTNWDHIQTRHCVMEESKCIYNRKSILEIQFALYLMFLYETRNMNSKMNKT